MGNNFLESLHLSDEAYVKYELAAQRYADLLNTDSEKDNLSLYFQITIVSYILAYKTLVQLLLEYKKNSTNILYHDMPVDSMIAIAILFRLIIHDLATLFYVYRMGLDAQFHVISRTVIEKMTELSLCINDIDFFKNFTRVTNISDTSLYKKYTKPEVMRERLISLSTTVRPYSTVAILSGSKVSHRISQLGHPFVHTNNLSQLGSYYISENGWVDLSVTNGRSGKDLATYQFMCELPMVYLQTFILELGIGFLTKNEAQGFDYIQDSLFKVYNKYIGIFYN